MSDTNENNKNILPEWLTVSTAPHFRNAETVDTIMWYVNLALLPAAIWGVVIFGWRALGLMVVCTSSAVATEWVTQKLRKVPVTAFDGSAFLTGLLLAFCVPPSLDFWMGGLGSVFAVFVAKHTFGGLGQNVFNPAHIGRAFLLASFPVHMTRFSATESLSENAVDAITTATPLSMAKEEGLSVMTEHFGSGLDLYWRLFAGNINGCIGEVSAGLLILGGLFMIYKGYIRWEAPAIYIFTVGLLSWMFCGESGIFSGDPFFAMLSGGLILGAFFMITDYVTTPITRGGQMIFALCAGILVWLIRKYGGYPEGVCYSILLMNCFSPLIDRWFTPRQYGVKYWEERTKE